MATKDNLSPQAVALAREIETKIVGLEDQDLFGVLGLTRSCTLEEVFWAHETLARWFDPGRLLRLRLEKLRPFSQRIVDQLDYARWILGDETSRRAYEAQTDGDFEIVVDIAA
jgi:hypothetical protein